MKRFAINPKPSCFVSGMCVQHAFENSDTNRALLPLHEPLQKEAVVKYRKKLFAT
jgi:hypothetical protein